MKNEGKTVVIVHHDLQTANEYFDHIVLLNTRLVAAGPKDKVFTKELLQEAYGGRLTVLSKLGDLISTEEFPLREAEFRKTNQRKNKNGSCFPKGFSGDNPFSSFFFCGWCIQLS